MTYYPDAFDLQFVLQDCYFYDFLSFYLFFVGGDEGRGDGD